MAVEFIRVPTSTKKLSDELIRFVDDFQQSRISQEDFVEVLQTWMNNAPKLLLADDGSSNALSPSVIKYIGKKRAIVIATVLANFSKQ